MAGRRQEEVGTTRPRSGEKELYGALLGLLVTKELALMPWGAINTGVHQFRGGLVFKAHRRLYHSTIIKKKKSTGKPRNALAVALAVREVAAQPISSDTM